MVLRDGRVVRQPRPGQVDARLVAHAAVRREHVVREPRLEIRIAVVDVLARERIDLAVRVERRVQPAAEGFLARGLEGQRIQRMDPAGVVPGRKQLAVVQVQRRVRGVLAVVRVHRVDLVAGDPRQVVRAHHARQPDLAGLDLLMERAGLHPLADVAGLAVAEVDAMHHAVAIEPVVGAARLEDRVGSLAQRGAIQVRRDLALRDGQVHGGDLRDHRRVGAVQVGVVDAVDPARAVRRILRVEVGVLAHASLLRGAAVHSARPMTKLTVVVALPPTFRVAKVAASSTW